MCDSIANGGPRFIASSGGSCPPANVTIASNVLDTNGNVICANIIAGDGTFTGNLYIAGEIIGNIVYNSINISGTANIGVLEAGVVFGDGYGLSNLQASSIVGTVSQARVANLVADSYQPNIGSLVNLYVANSVTTTNISTQIITSSLFIGNGSAISNLNSSNLVGNVANATVALVVSQASQPNITSVGTLSSLTVAGLVQGNLISGNGSAISNINSSNLVGNVANTDVALVVSQASQPNITSVGTLSSLTVAGILQGNLFSGNGYAISNLNSSNLIGNVASANLALMVTQASQPTITSVGILTGLLVAGSTQSSVFFGDGSGISNMNSSNLVGNVANANVALVVSQSSQPNITSVGTLTGLNVAGIIQGYALRGDGSGISNMNSSNLVGNVANATVSRVVSQASQPNITSVGTLTGLTVSGLTTSGYFLGDGQGITNINPSNISGAVAQSIVAITVSGNSQPNITSLGTLSSLTVSGVSSAGLFSGNGFAISNINSSNLVGAVASANLAVAVTGNAQPNITSLGNLLVLNVISTITAGYFEGDGGHLENLPGANVTGNVARSDLAIYVSSAYQPNITSLGTLTGLTVAGLTQGGLFSGNGSAISNINSSNLTGTISTSRFPLSGVVAGLYGSSANVSQLVIDTYGRVTAATNVAITSSQWTTIASNVAYQNGVSIGTLSSPPTGSNLYVLGTASISNILGTISTPNQPLVTSLGTLDNLTVAGFISANGYAISNLNSSNLVGNVAAADMALVVTQASQPNITSVGTLSSLTVSGNLSGGLFIGNASALSNIQASNLIGAAPYAVVVSGGYQPNITSVGTLSALSVAGTTVSGYFTGDGRFLTNLTSSSLVGNVANADVALVVSQAAQPNITSTGILTSLNVTGISNLTALAGSLMTSAQGNITSVGTLISLNVSNAVTATRFVGIHNGAVEGSNAIAGSTISGTTITGTRFVGILNGAVEGANAISGTTISGSLTTSAQGNITSVGTLTSLNVSNAVTATRFAGILNGAVEGSNAIAGSTISGTTITGTRFVGILNGAVEGSNAIAGTTISGSLTTSAQGNITSVGTLTSLNVSNAVTATRFVGILNGAVEGSNAIAGTTISGSLTTSAQGNITSVGTLTSLGVTNEVTATRFIGILNGAVEGANAIAGSTISGSLTTSAQGNITSVGTLTSLGVTNAVTATRFVGILNGAVEGSNTISGTTITGTRFVGILNGAVEGANAIAGTTISGSLTTSAQGNITSVGTLTALNVSNAVTATRFVGILNGAVEGANAIAGSTISGSLMTSAQGNITSVGTLTSLNVSNAVAATRFVGILNGAVEGSNAITGSTISGTTITATRFVGIFNGAVEGANAIAGTTISGSLTTSAQGNITSVGTLTSLNVSNAVTATRFVGIFNGAVEGSNAIAGSTISGTTITGTRFVGILNGAVEGANAIAGTTISGSLTTSAQGNITSVGTLTALNVSNAVTATRFVGILNGAVEGANAIAGTTISGSLTTSAQGNITSVGTLTSLGVTNEVTATRFIGILNGAVEGANAIAGTTITGTTITGTRFVGILNGAVEGANAIAGTTISGSLTTSAQGNITSVGTLTSLGVTNAVTATRFVGIFNGAVEGANAISGTTISGSLTTSAQGNITSVGTLTALNVSNAVTATRFVGILNGAVEGANAIAGTTISGSLTTSAQGNITSVGTLTSLGVTNAVTATRFVGILNGAVEGANAIAGTTISGSLTTSAQGNITSVGTLTSLGVTNAVTATRFVGIHNGAIEGANAIAGSTISGSLTTSAQGNITSVGTLSTLNVTALSNLGSLVTPLANVANLNVSVNTTTSYLTVTSNILPGAPTGNTYLTGNIIVSGNVFSSTGSPLGAGGGIYLSLGSTYAVPTSYNGGVYGTTYPLTVGLSNNFFITGTSTFITITSNGNFRFSQAGAYLLKAVFNGSDNVTGLAVGQAATDTHATDQNYLYRYTTFVTQNPSELIQIPFNVVNTSNTYYLDLFMISSGASNQLFATSNTLGGTYLTIEPLQGGGVATGGPGGTPPSQWSTSGPNIYFSNSVGIGAVNPAYNLDVSTGTTATQRLITSNISSLGIYGDTLNVASNVIIQSNLAVGGGSVPNNSPPYALYVTGQGYFSEHVTYENFSGYRNRIINGTFRIGYRANTITISNTSSFSLSNSWVMDRWHIDVGNLSTSNVSMTAKQASPVGPPNGFSNCSNVYVSRAMGGVTDNTWICPLVQTCEASGTFDLRLGQPTAKHMVLSFYANTSTVGTYSVVLRSKADNTYFANLVTLTNSWNRYTVYLPPCTIGTWGTGTAGSVEVCLLGVSWGTGRANVAPTTTWTASPGYAPMAVTGATPWPQTVGTFIQVTGVQLELGTIPTPFEIRLLAETTRLCQRYYENNPDIQYSSALGSGRVSSIPFVVTKREHANVSVYTTLSNLTANTNISQFTSITTGGSYANTAITSYTTSDYGFTFTFTQGGGANKIDEAQFVWQADAEIY